jgi:hypothetical protein
MLNGQELNNAYPSMNLLGKAFSEVMQSGKSTLGYDTNTLYPGFPPKMSDGRALIASWQPEAILNRNLVESAGVDSNWKYRKYLTKNADEIMDYNRKESANDIGYYMRFPKSDILTSDSSSRMKETTDLKQLYLSREELDARKISPSIDQATLIRGANANTKNNKHNN